MRGDAGIRAEWSRKPAANHTAGATTCPYDDPMGRREFARRGIVATLCTAVALVGSGCGGSGPSQDEAITQFNNWTKAVNRANDDLTGEYVKQHKTVAQWRRLSTKFKKHNRIIESAWDKAPDYVRRIHRKTYKLELKKGRDFIVACAAAVKLGYTDRSNYLAMRKAISRFSRAGRRAFDTAGAAIDASSRGRREAVKYVKTL